MTKVMVGKLEVWLLSPEEAEQVWGTRRHARANRQPTLAYIVEQAAAQLPTLECCNCDGAFIPRARPFLFCSEWCRQFAKHVRYERAVWRDGRIEQADVEDAIRVRRAMLMGGGYPEAQRHLSRNERTAIFDRDGGLCRQCGRKATQIDHIGGKHVSAERMNDPDNLQAICDECHKAKTRAALKPVSRESDPELWAHCRIIAAMIDERVDTETPKRPCDDQLTWRHTMRQMSADRTRQIREAYAESVLVLVVHSGCACATTSAIDRAEQRHNGMDVSLAGIASFQ